MKDLKLVSSGYLKGCACVAIRNVWCNIAEILKGAEMIRYQNSSKWNEMVFPEANQMADEGGGHHAYITNELPGSMLLKCYQHCGSECLFLLNLLILCVFVAQ